MPCTIFVQADRADAPAIAPYSKLGTRAEVLHFDIRIWVKEPIEQMLIGDLSIAAEIAAHCGSHLDAAARTAPGSR
jgi:hypothetical protein